jgi:uncharacterized protein YjiS (DUF1127 family)
VNFQPAGGIEGHGMRLVRDIGEILRELRHRGPGGLFKAWYARRHYRQELGRLLRVGRHMISDIGLTVAEAEDAVDRPFWRA